MTTGRINQVTIPTPAPLRPCGKSRSSPMTANCTHKMYTAAIRAFVTFKIQNRLPGELSLAQKLLCLAGHPNPPDSHPFVKISQSTRTGITDARRGLLQVSQVRNLARPECIPKYLVETDLTNWSAHPQHTPADPSTEAWAHHA